MSRKVIIANIFLIIIAALIAVIYIFVDVEGRSGFTSNTLATFIGILIGIPITFLVNQIVQSSEEAQNKRRILKLIRAELEYDISQAEKIAQGEVSGSDNMHWALMKSESWDAFSNGGDLKWIREPELLSKIADAYFLVKPFIQLQRLYMEMNYIENRSAGDLLKTIKISASRFTKDIHQVIEQLGKSDKQ